MSSLHLLAAARTEQDLQIEMVRMCVAEAGYDPESIQPYDGPGLGYTFYCVGSVAPPEVCWRARELVGIGQPKCYRCTLHHRAPLESRPPCRAGERFELDCGAQGSDDDHEDEDESARSGTDGGITSVSSRSWR